MELTNRKLPSCKIPPVLKILGIRWVGRKPKMMLLLIEKKPHISRRELSEAIDISETTVSKHFKVLKAKGLLQRIGTNKFGY